MAERVGVWAAGPPSAAGSTQVCRAGTRACTLRCTAGSSSPPDLTAALWKLVCVRELLRLAASEVMVLNTPLASSREQPDLSEAALAAVAVTIAMSSSKSATPRWPAEAAPCISPASSE